MRLKGKRAFISGAGSGIGEAAALKFAAEGARVILADIRSPAVEAVAARIVAEGGEALAVSGDIADPEQCRHMIDEGAMRLGGLDLMFNNAGIVLGEDTGPVETPLEIWEQTIRVNLTGVFLACKFGIPHLLLAGGGAVVNNASVVALVGSAYPQIAYTAAKGGLAALTRDGALPPSGPVWCAPSSRRNRIGKRGGPICPWEGWGRWRRWPILSPSSSPTRPPISQGPPMPPTAAFRRPM